MSFCSSSSKPTLYTVTDSSTPLLRPYFLTTFAPSLTFLSLFLLFLRHYLFSVPPFFPSLIFPRPYRCSVPSLPFLCLYIFCLPTFIPSLHPFPLFLRRPYLYSVPTFITSLPFFVPPFSLSLPLFCLYFSPSLPFLRPYLFSVPIVSSAFPFCRAYLYFVPSLTPSLPFLLFYLDLLRPYLYSVPVFTSSLPFLRSYLFRYLYSKKFAARTKTFSKPPEHKCISVIFSPYIAFVAVSWIQY